jgi:hypothetical protein
MRHLALGEVWSMGTRNRCRLVVSCIALLTGLAIATPARADSIILNGGFESGLASWTTADQIGSDGTFWLQSGVTSPVNAFTVPPPPEGTSAAMTDAQGPGTHVLYQDFVVPSVVDSAILSFALFIDNQGLDFYAPGHLDFSTELNQQARVDLLLPGLDPFTTSILLNVFQTNPGDPPLSGYTTYTTDVTALLAAHAGQTLRLRFAEVDNIFFFNLGVDAVSLDVTSTPEPASLLLMGAGFAAMAFRRRRR